MKLVSRATRLFQYGFCVSLLLGTCAFVLAADEQGKIFEAPGATIYFEIVGSGTGTPLLIVNGGPGAAHDYMHRTSAWDAIAKSRQVVFYDQRGTGRSLGDHKGQTFKLKEQIEDIDALRAHLGFDHMDILGHSWGGMLATAYAAAHPDRVSHFIYVDSGSPKGVKDTIFLFDNIYPDVQERSDSLAFAVGMGDEKAEIKDQRNYFSMLFYSSEKRDAFLASIPANVSFFNKEIQKAVWSDFEQFDLMPEVRKFRFPVIVITGRFDINVAPLVAYRIHQAIPNSEFKVFEHSGHLPFYEEPQSFVAVLEQFLARQ